MTHGFRAPGELKLDMREEVYIRKPQAWILTKDAAIPIPIHAALPPQANLASETIHGTFLINANQPLWRRIYKEASIVKVSHEINKGTWMSWWLALRGTTCA